MRRLCFGGSFNPIHHAHLICARAAVEAGGFDRLALIPSAQPPHKPHSAYLAKAEHRLEMCRLAAGVEADRFEVLDLELGRSGPSYTLDSVRELKGLGWGEVHWLIGADMLQQLPTWHEADRLIEEAEFWVLARPGWELDWSILPTAYRKLERRVLPAPLVDIRATDIRQRVADRKSIEFLVPQAVAGYIALHGLYR